MIKCSISSKFCNSNTMLTLYIQTNGTIKSSFFFFPFSFLLPFLFCASVCTACLYTHKSHCSCGGQRTVHALVVFSFHQAGSRENSGHQVCTTSTLICWVISPTQMLTSKKYFSSHFSVYFQIKEVYHTITGIEFLNRYSQ